MAAEWMNTPLGEADPYVILGVTPPSTDDEIKKAYRRRALLCHPDKYRPPPGTSASESVRVQEMHARGFHLLSQCYAVLSDPNKKLIFDQSGSLDDALASFQLSGDYATWDSYFREIYRTTITPERIAAEEARYRETEEERLAVLEAYTQTGRIFDVLDSVIGAREEDLDRFTRIVETAIAEQEIRPVPPAGMSAKTDADPAKWKTWCKGGLYPTAAQKKERAALMSTEAAEAEQEAERLGLKKKGKRVDTEADLAQLMLQRRQQSAGVWDQLFAKYENLEREKSGRRGGKVEKAGGKRKAAAKASKSK